MPERIVCDIAIVGAGPAGLAAMDAATTSGASVAIIDENREVGGQIFRAYQGRRNRAVRQIEFRNVNLVLGASVVDIDPTGWLLCESLEGPVEVEFQQLVLATGARELFLPFPGWTLPGVFGAGGLQALVKQGLSVRGKRVVLSGTGPLLLAVARFLSHSGASVLTIAEQARPSDIRRVVYSLLRNPKKLMEAMEFWWTVRKLYPGWYVVRAEGNHHLESVTITNGKSSRKLDTDYLACGFGLIPNTEAAELAGCRIEDGRVWTDRFLRTSCDKIYAPGEATGVGGLGCARIEGKIAGLAASGNISEAKEYFKAREKARQFAAVLENTYALRPELKQLPEDQTIVCRCEDVRLGDIKNRKSFREAKLQTRLGMGPCQGRICGAACRFLLGWENPGVRPPLLPTRVETLIER